MPTPEHDRDESVSEGFDYVYWIGVTVIVIGCSVVAVATFLR